MAGKREHFAPDTRPRRHLTEVGLGEPTWQPVPGGLSERHRSIKVHIFSMENPGDPNLFGDYLGSWRHTRSSESGSFWDWTISLSENEAAGWASSDRRGPSRKWPFANSCTRWAIGTGSIGETFRGNPISLSRRGRQPSSSTVASGTATEDAHWRDCPSPDWTFGSRSSKATRNATGATLNNSPRSAGVQWWSGSAR